MKNIKYKIHIKGLHTPSGSIHITALKDICEAIVEGAGRALRLSIEGVSIRKGNIPNWQKKATEFIITGITDGSTTLLCDAPVLDDVIPDEISQQNLWYKGPQPDDTAISVYSRSIKDILSHDVESDQYDKGVIDSLKTLKPLLQQYASDCEIISDDRPQESFCLNAATLEDAFDIQDKTPEPQTIIVSGMFDLIQHSEGKFKLALESSYKVVGEIDPSFIDLESMRDLWGTKVTIKGVAYYTASGRIRFIQAQTIKSFEEQERVFEELPKSQSVGFLFKELESPIQSKGALASLWGKWPGNETIEELLSTLNEDLEGK